jgi:hypothetical protein
MEKGGEELVPHVLERMKFTTSNPPTKDHQKNSPLKCESFRNPQIHDVEGNCSANQSFDLLLQQGFC